MGFKLLVLPIESLDLVIMRPTHRIFQATGSVEIKVEEKAVCVLAKTREGVASMTRKQVLQLPKLLTLAKEAWDRACSSWQPVNDARFRTRRYAFEVLRVIEYVASS